jgi:hypothetical protein
MNTSVSAKLLKIAEDIQAEGQAGLTRLTILKKWFEQQPGRLPAFGVWMAKTALAQADEPGTDLEGALFELARRLLAGADPLRPALNREAASGLFQRLQAFQNQHRPVAWGNAVREIHNWNLLLIEQGLGLCLGRRATPTAGYHLAANFCKHYDPRFGTSLNGPSLDKVKDIARFVAETEALESAPPASS